MKLRIINIIAVLIFSFQGLLSQEPDKTKKLVVVAKFRPYFCENEPKLEEKILDKIKNGLISKNFETKTIPAGKSKDQIVQAQKINAFLLINGFYKRNKRNEGLVIYSQVYHPQKGHIIDALRISDILAELGDIQIEEGVKTSNEETINKIVERLMIRLSFNLDRKIRSGNINDFLVTDPIFKEFHFPVERREQKKRLEDIFTLLGETQVVTASKRRQKIEDAPANIEVVTDRMISERGYMYLEEVLWDVPGFDIVHENGIATNKVYQRGYRSKNSDRTLLMIDGVIENDIWKGQFWMGRQYPMLNIKRIEILHGPSSVLYGANAFLGVINVITKDGKDIRGAKVEAGGGFWETAYSDIVIGNKYDKLDYILTVRGWHSNEDYAGKKEFNPDNYKQFDFKQDGKGPKEVYLQKEGTKFPKGLAEQSGIYSGWRNLKEDGAVHLKMQYENFKIGGLWWSRYDDSGMTYTEIQHFNRPWHIRNLHFFSEYLVPFWRNKLISTTKFVYKRHEHVGANSNAFSRKEFEDPADDPTGNNREFYYTAHYSETISKQFWLEEQIDLKPNKYFELLSGLKVKDSFIQGDYVHNPDLGYPSETGYVGGKPGEKVPGAGNHYDIYDIGVFLEGNFSIIETIKLIIGSRYDYNKIRNTGGYGGIFNPRGGFLFQPPWISGLNLKALYGEAFYDVENWTKYSTVIGKREIASPNLQPEKVKTIETVLSHKYKNFYNSINFFISYFSNIARTAIIPCDQAHCTTETTEKVEAGNEMEIWGWTYNFDMRLKNWLSLGFNYSYVYPVDMNEELMDLPEEDRIIGDIARNKINIYTNIFLFKHLNINVRLNWRDSIAPQAENGLLKDPNYELPSYFIIKTCVTWFDLFTPGLDISVIVNNVLNATAYMPGVRSADGVTYPTKIVSKPFSIYGRLTYHWDLERK
jgi:outer membrane receptor protein involved in Fe transport